MFPSRADLLRVLPELILCAGGTLLMLLQPFLRNRHALSFLALLSSAAATASAAFYFSPLYPGTAFNGLLRADGFSFFFHVLIGLVVFLVLLASASYLDRERLAPAEFYALVLFAAAGMGVLASAQELLTAFIGLELSSISSYVLAGYRRESPRSGEAAMKYFLLGSFATAFFLYGVALVYGATRTTFLPRMAASDGSSTLVKLGLALILIGLAFKVSAAPFQVWTPDVYEGAPTPVTALFSAGPKAAAFALLLRIFSTAPTDSNIWFRIFWILAALTMFTGNLGALVQSSVKRMLAYSSIAHAGYILVAICTFAFRDSDEVNRSMGLAAVLYYLVAYALMKLGAFTVVSHLGGVGEKNLSLDDYAGLGRRQPFAAAALSLFLLSLLGLPATAGFFGKFYIFKAALHSHLLWLAVLMAVNSIIGAYYYLRLIVVMYMREPRPDAASAPFSFAVSLVLTITALGTVYFGLFPNSIISFASQPGLLAR
jgi:NADH-quinone oxidoreductase subunit N